MKVTPGFDPTNKMITLEIKTNLLKKYYSNFEGMISEDSNIPGGTHVRQEDENIAIISFPLPEDAMIKNGPKDGMGIIGVNPDSLKVFITAINRFINAALRKEFKTTEFIPLDGYPIENLQLEIREAIKNKRNFCIIDTYDNYQKLRDMDYEFNHAIVEFGTLEYSKTAILVNKGDLQGIRDMWSGKLKVNNWN